MITIRDVALKCKVSISTVSKALNNANDISEETKNKIKEIAKEMGYTANVSARALRTNKTKNIGVIFSNCDQMFTHEFFSNVLECFKTEVENNDYDITFINDKNKKNFSYEKHCENRGFDGVAIISANFEDKRIKELINSNIPVVTLDHVFKKCSAVISDNTNGMSELVEYAIQMGHRKIAYIHGEETWVTKDRLTGFYATIRKYKLDIPDEYLIESEYRNPYLAELKTKELLNLKDPPTCILYPDDYSMINAIQIIKDSKMNISYMGFDGISISEVMGITTYEQNREALGTIAAKKLIECIEHPNSLIEHTVISGKVKIRDSVTKI